MTTPCILCATTLEPTELLTCRLCVSDVRRGLSSIEALYALLPDLLGQPAAVGLGTVMGISGSEPPLPGGDALAMLAPGAPATSWSRGQDHGPSGEPTDPPAVAFELATWCEDWAGIRGESRWPIVVPGCVDWLGTRLGWAGSHHMAFDAFAADVSRIGLRLAAVTGTLDVPERGASCPYCGTALEREYGDQGRVDDWSCRRCHRAFNEGQYNLAMAMVRLAHPAGA